jgi:SAM-dependent methyltransferase
MRVRWQPPRRFGVVDGAADTADEPPAPDRVAASAAPRVPLPEWWHDAYERGRPEYPGEAVDVVGLSWAGTVLELAAGTGKLTRLLVPSFRSVIAVEPDAGMRRLLRAVCPDAAVLAGTAEHIPLATATVDAVFAAEAFHWFDSQLALPEIVRVLRPRGALIAMWNVPACPTVPSIEGLEQLVNDRGPTRQDLHYEPGDPSRFASGEWQRAFERSPFEELQEARLPNPQTVDPDGIIAFLASMGWIAELPDLDRSALLEEARSLLTSNSYTRLWETRVYWTRLAPPKR